MTAARATVVIAAKDEEGIVGSIVDECRPHADEILVVDGHTRDPTRQIARRTTLLMVDPNSARCRP